MAIDTPGDLFHEQCVCSYNAAISLWMYQGQGTWAIFNSMVIAQSTFVAAESILVVYEMIIYIPFIALMGIMVSLFWYILITRKFAIHNYWINAAKEIEEKFLKPEIRVVGLESVSHPGFRGQFMAKGIIISFLLIQLYFFIITIPSLSLTLP